MTSQSDLRSEQSARRLKLPEEKGFDIRHEDQAHPEHHVHRIVIESITTRFVDDGNGGLETVQQVVRKER